MSKTVRGRGTKTTLSVGPSYLARPVKVLANGKLRYVPKLIIAGGLVPAEDS